jgi:prealbumin domain-containing protein
MAAFNFKRRRTRRWWYAGATLMAAAFFAVFFVVGASAVTNSPSHFESSDGNMTVEGSPATDWNCFANGGSSNTSGFVTSGINTGTGTCAKTSGATAVTADSAGEITWVNGQKFDTQCPRLQTGSVPNKDDITNVAEFEEFATSGDLFFYGGAIRQTANGNASGDVEFNQSSGNGTSSAGCRTAGDRLVAYDFLNGGTSLDFHVLTWITSASPNGGGNSGKCLVKTDSLPCWGANVITVSASEFDGQANQAAILAAANGISGGALAIQQFAEFGVNLTQALGGGPLPCFPQQVWETRSSGSSFTSNPEDIEFVHVSTCGALKITKMAKNLNLGTGLKPESGVTFTISNSSGFSTTVTTGTDGTVCTGSLSPGSYTVTETVPSGYSADNSPQTVTVASGTTCTNPANPTTANFTNTPLTDLTVNVASEITGATNSSISCVNSSSTAIGNSPQPTTGKGDPETVTANGLKPGTYTCTVVIDP